MESYKLVIAFQAMEELAEQGTARRANAAPTSPQDRSAWHVAGAQRHEPSRLARLGTALRSAISWLQGWRWSGAVRGE